MNRYKREVTSPEPGVLIALTLTRWRRRLVMLEIWTKYDTQGGTSYWHYTCYKTGDKRA